MSDENSDDGLPLGGRRKDGKPYKSGNERGDGSYEVGKGRPPDNGKFKTGDGRPRGRKTKGSKHFDTIFLEEASRTVSIKENGQVRRVSKERATIVRLFDNANSKGDNPAIATVIATRRQIADRQAEAAAKRAIDDDFSLIDAFLLDRAAVLGIDPALLGDPPTPIERDGDEPHGDDEQSP